MFRAKTRKLYCGTIANTMTGRKGGVSDLTINTSHILDTDFQTVKVVVQSSTQFML